MYRVNRVLNYFCKHRLLIGLFTIVSTGILFAQNHPGIGNIDVNTVNPGKYEKLQIEFSIKEVELRNPYNPEEIDVRGIFTSPSGKEWNQFGFYDNFQNQNTWKVRFAPNETGEWDYQLKVYTATDSCASDRFTFQVSESEHHGWIKVSPDNPHYFMHDDGTSFYGVGPYYPWGVNNGSTGLAQLEKYGANFWGYWNIPYGGEIRIIESMQSGLGRYDQEKCGRIDQLIEWSEQRDLKMMLAIWPHDLLSASVWAHQWHNNPYNTITDVINFWASEQAWRYQERQYRYLIARWGYSRALGVWEIVNEVNGTDGWENGRQDEARRWVGRVHDFFKTNDPTGRPTTASMSGGQYWPEGYAEVDISNVHMYETGWLAPYGGNPLRSSVYTYSKITRKMWNDFNQPAIMGEAGYTNNYGDFTAGSPEYTEMFHNALWAGWANGLAAMPVWWDFGSKQLMTTEVMRHMGMFAGFVKTIDYAHKPFQPVQISAFESDAAAMHADGTAFGWIRQRYGLDISGTQVKFKGVPDTSYSIHWYDTWAGEVVAQQIGSALDNVLNIRVPVLDASRPDIAFYSSPIKDGTEPYQLGLVAEPPTLLNHTASVSQLSCYVLDRKGRLCRDAAVSVRFEKSGPGYFLSDSIKTVRNGIAVIEYQAAEQTGTCLFTATAQGLLKDSVTIEITDRMNIDGFDQYQNQFGLETVWKIRSGTGVQFALDSDHMDEGSHSLKISYAIGTGYAPYAGLFKKFQDHDFSGAKSLQFWIKPDASNRILVILLKEKSGRYWTFEEKSVLTGKSPIQVSILLEQFTASDTAQDIDLSNLSELAFNITSNTGDSGPGVFYLDTIRFSTDITTGVEKINSRSPKFFKLHPMFPNPFNASTRIAYELADPALVDISVINMRGQTVETLLEQKQNAGIHHIVWNAESTHSGIYFIRLQVAENVKSRKCVLLK